MSTSKAHVADSLEPYRCYIGGRWIGASSGRTFDDVEPYSGRLFARVAAGVLATGSLSLYTQTSLDANRMVPDGFSDETRSHDAKIQAPRATTRH